MYLTVRLKGAYEMYLTYKGETYSKWVTYPYRLDHEAELLVEQVIELWGLRNSEGTRKMLYDELDWEFVERKHLPVYVEQKLQEEESYLVEEIDYDY